MAKGKYRNKHNKDPWDEGFELTEDGTAGSSGEDTGENSASEKSAREEKTTWVFDDRDIKGGEDEVTPGRMIDAYFERQAAEDAAGKSETTYGFWGKLYRILDYTSKKTPHARVKKSTYLILLVFLGWMGGHRYYEKRYYVGLLYTLFCWSGIPFVMCVIDAMIVIPKKPGEDGLIQM